MFPSTLHFHASYYSDFQSPPQERSTPSNLHAPTTALQIKLLLKRARAFSFPSCPPRSSRCSLAIAYHIRFIRHIVCYPFNHAATRVRSQTTSFSKTAIYMKTKQKKRRKKRKTVERYARQHRTYRVKYFPVYGGPVTK